MCICTHVQNMLRLYADLDEHVIAQKWEKFCLTRFFNHKSLLKEETSVYLGYFFWDTPTSRHQKQLFLRKSEVTRVEVLRLRS